MEILVDTLALHWPICSQNRTSFNTCSYIRLGPQAGKVVRPLDPLERLFRPTPPPKKNRNVLRLPPVRSKQAWKPQGPSKPITNQCQKPANSSSQSRFKSSQNRSDLLTSSTSQIYSELRSNPTRNRPNSQPDQNPNCCLPRTGQIHLKKIEAGQTPL